MIDEAMLLREAMYDILERDPQETKAVMKAAAYKIEELRSMLAERGDEIAELKNRLHDTDQSVGNLEAVIKTQRKLLEQAQSGMTLRDYFAAKVMQAFWADDNLHPSVTHEDAANWSYEMADAMLEARKPKEQP